MIKQYIKQALRMIGENKLLSVISILGTALAICMIMVIVILYVVNTASFKPEVNRGRTCYITTVMSNGKDDNRRISYSSLGLPLVKECCYPLKGAEAVTAINMDRYRPLTASSMDGLKNRTSYISYTDTAFWKIFQFDFQQGGPFSPAAFTSGIRDAVISESVALALFGTDQVVGREMKLDFIVYNICGVVKDVSRFASKAWAEVWIPYTVRDDGGYQEGINGSYSCCVLLRPGVTREELRTEALRKVEEFNAKTRDVKADILHQPSTQIEEWIAWIIEDQHALDAEQGLKTDEEALTARTDAIRAAPDSWAVTQGRLEAYREEIAPHVDLRLHPLLAGSQRRDGGVYARMLRAVCDYVEGEAALEDCLTRLETLADSVPANVP